MARIALNGRTARAPSNGVTLEQLREAWTVAEKAMVVVLSQDSKLTSQEQWLERNTEHPDFLEKQRQVLWNRQAWHIDSMGGFMDKAAKFGQLARRAGPELEAPLWDVHPYASLGSDGLHRLYNEKAVDMGLIDRDRILEEELPF